VNQLIAAGRDVEDAGISMAGALLPKNYERACAALTELARIDECQQWADKAEALRSYARQADDPTLLNHSMRIKARAVRRCGELLAAVAPAPGRIKEGALPNFGRSAAADEAGISEHQRKEALRVAAVPPEQFNAMVEAANPPTVSELANIGRKRRQMPDTEMGEDFLSPREADQGVADIARRLNTGLLINVSPGISACLAAAMKRASAQDRAIILNAAEFLAGLAETIK
jgi:hypothetical protein